MFQISGCADIKKEREETKDSISECVNCEETSISKASEGVGAAHLQENDLALLLTCAAAIGGAG